MIANLSDRRFIFYSERVNLRKSFSGLFLEVKRSGLLDLFYDNVGIIFINRRGNMFKCIYWENNSLAIWHKQLVQGTFKVKKYPKESISFQDLLMLIHGFIPPENRLN